MRAIAFSLAASFLFTACSGNEQTEHENSINILEPVYETLAPSQGKPDLSWMAGSWRDTLSFAHYKSQILERWTIENGVLKGTGFTLKAGEDTNISEVLTIDLNADTITFNAQVTGQNSGQTIAFTLQQFSEDSVQFVNFAHEFPQQIIYKRITNDSIHGIAAGFVQGVLRRSVTKLKRY